MAQGSQIDGLWLRKTTDTALDRAEAIALVIETAHLHLGPAQLSLLARTATLKPLLGGATLRHDGEV